MVAIQKSKAKPSSTTIVPSRDLSVIDFHIPALSRHLKILFVCSMGRKKRGSQSQTQIEQGTVPKKPKPETGESYLVKKYRPDRSTHAMDAFVKYTKSHRMLDAAYVRWSTGVTPEKPFVFSTRVGGQDLGWGRGKTRDAAIDCATRAAFALVGAHGYRNFPLDDDCLAEAPQDPLPPPPPPPPPMGLPPLPGGVPPLPPGYPPGLPPPPTGVQLPLPLEAHPPPPPIDLPQPQLVPTYVPAATAIATPSVVSNEKTNVSLDFSKSSEENNRKAIKGGLTLVFSPESDDTEEECMEEKRALLPQYLKMITNKS